MACQAQCFVLARVNPSVPNALHPFQADTTDLDSRAEGLPKNKEVLAPQLPVRESDILMMHSNDHGMLDMDRYLLHRRAPVAHTLRNAELQGTLVLDLHKTKRSSSKCQSGYQTSS